jgi:hypothetical protein
MSPALRTRVHHARHVPMLAQPLGASTASQNPDTQISENMSASRSERFVLPSPSPAAAFPEVSADHVRPHSGKLELLDLDEWNENEPYDEEPATCLH